MQIAIAHSLLRTARSSRSKLKLAFLSILLSTSLVAAQDAPPPATSEPKSQDSAPAAQKAKEELQIKIGYLKQDVDRLLPISRLDYPTPDLGIAGAQVAINDNNTTGKFLNQSYSLTTETVPEGGDAVAALNKLIGEGNHFILIDAPADKLLQLADAAKGKDVTLFNVRAPETRLREEDCRINVLHTALSHAQQTDAIAQYLIWKKWPLWFLIRGDNPQDINYANAVKRAAKRFGGEIVEERVYKGEAGARGTDAGHQQVQEQMPLFTQDVEPHHIVFAADESQIFGPYLPYRTWDPRPVVGTAGLRAVSWHPSQEQWGGRQLNTRFEDYAKRYMRPLDYNAWVAVRTVGEAVTRSKTADPEKLREYILSEEFGLGVYKGENVSYRSWNHQLRTPIVLANLKLPVTVSPQVGFLHQKREVDTLGIDEPESKCEFE